MMADNQEEFLISGNSLFVEIYLTAHENLTLLSKATLDPFAYLLFDIILATLSFGASVALTAHKL
jgi:hypothetical protein